MAIVAKSVLAARRAAAAAAKAAAPATAENMPSSVTAETSPSSVRRAEIVSPPSRVRVSPPIEQASPVAASTPKRRGHATKDENGKWQPTGDKPGFANPPVHSRFQIGNKGGPGRPKGSISHDALLKKQLDEKREVSIGGCRIMMSGRELLVKSTMKAALENKDKTARSYLLAWSERLYASRDSSDSAPAALTVSDSDALSMAEYENELRALLRAEVRAELLREARDVRDDGQ